MKLLKQPWFLILVFVVGVYTFQFYNNPKIVEFSSNKASATSKTSETSDISQDGGDTDSKLISVKVTKSFKASKIKNFELATYLSMKIEFSKSDGEDIIISLVGEGDEYKNDGQNFSDWFEVTEKKGTLKLASHSDDNFEGFSSLKNLAKTFKGDENHNKTFIIEFPESFKFSNIKLEGVSNDIFANQLSFDSLNVARVSGNLVLTDCQGKTLKLETVSGDNNVAMSDLVSAEFATVSGSTQLKSMNTNPRIKFESVSGNLALQIPEDSQVEIDFESMTGDLVNDFGKSQGGTNPIKFSSLSGSAKINKL